VEEKESKLTKNRGVAKKTAQHHGLCTNGRPSQERGGRLKRKRISLPEKKKTQFTLTLILGARKEGAEKKGFVDDDRGEKKKSAGTLRQGPRREDSK